MVGVGGWVVEKEGLGGGKGRPLKNQWNIVVMKDFDLESSISRSCSLSPMGWD